jgi:hypothetical protein
MQKVHLDLTTLDGNAFSLLGAFRRAALDAGWTKDAIKAVIEEAMQGEYDHLLRTLLVHIDEQGAERYQNRYAIWGVARD